MMRRSWARTQRRQQARVIGPMQAAVDEVISQHRLALPSLVRVVANKLEAQGATLTDDLLEWLEEEIEKRITKVDGLTLDTPFHSEEHLVDGKEVVPVV